MAPLTFSIGCTIPSYTAWWRHSNPAVARLTPRQDSKGTVLLGLGPGSTVVTVEILGNDGARSTATTLLRVVP